MRITKLNLIIAGILAVLADLLQVALFPIMLEGAFSPLDDMVDFVVAAAMTGLLGWHWVFLPTAVGKLVPGMDMAPLWTVAVFWVAVRGKKQELRQPPQEQLAGQRAK